MNRYKIDFLEDGSYVIKPVTDLNESFDVECDSIEDIDIDVNNKTFKVKTINEKLQHKKSKLKFELDKNANQYINKYYPDWKKQSDTRDENAYGSELLLLNNTYTVDYIYKTVREKVQDILNNTTTLQNVINSFPQTEQLLWEQLIKAGLRTAFFIRVKEEYRQKFQQIENATTIDELNLIDVKTFNTKFPL